MRRVCRYFAVLLAVGCLWAWLACVRAGAQTQPSPPIMMVPSDSTLPPPPDGAAFAPRGAGNAGGAPPQADGPVQESYTWQLFPDGLMYPSYLAGEREPRIGSEWVYDRRMGWIWNIALGARVGLLRFGNEDKLLPEGLQLDLEAAAFPRLQVDMTATWWRSTSGGGALTWQRALGNQVRLRITSARTWAINTCWRSGRCAGEFLPRRPGAGAGLSADPRRAALRRSRVGRFTAGATPSPGSFSSASSTVLRGPRAAGRAVRGHQRPSPPGGEVWRWLTVQAGWQWRGRSGHLFRIGLEYFNGKSEQYQFGDEYEQQIGVGMWYDF